MRVSLKVEITNVTSRRDPPGSVVEYRVLNQAGEPLWMVDDGWIIWRQDGPEIDVSLARGRMRPGAVFGYFDPEVREIPAAASETRKLTLDWPLELGKLWNDRDQATPEPGRHDLRLHIGYGWTRAPGPLLDGEDVEDPVLRWQQESVSESYPIEIGEYRATRAGDAP